MVNSGSFKVSKKFEYKEWKFGSIEALFMTRYCAAQGQYSCFTISLNSSVFWAKLDWDRLFTIKATLSWTFSGGTTSFSSFSVATSSVSIFVAFAIDGYKK